MSQDKTPKLPVKFTNCLPCFENKQGGFTEKDAASEFAPQATRKALKGVPKGWAPASCLKLGADPMLDRPENLGRASHDSCTIFFVQEGRNLGVSPWLLQKASVVPLHVLPKPTVGYQQCCNTNFSYVHGQDCVLVIFVQWLSKICQGSMTTLPTPRNPQLSVSLASVELSRITSWVQGHDHLVLVGAPDYLVTI